MSLNQKEIRALRSQGTKAYHANSQPDVDTLPTNPPEYDGRRDVSLGLCNAIRVAVDNGDSYREVARVFSIDPSTVKYHATGRVHCQHDSLAIHDEQGVPPVASCFEEGPPNKLSRRECDTIRERLVRGESEKWSALSSHDYATNRRHGLGECQHDTDPLPQPDVSPGRIRERREACGLTQPQLGELVNRDRTTISDWERGEKSPSLCMQFVVDQALESVE